MDRYSFNYRRGAITEERAEIQALFDEAKRAIATAYAPYSGFRVGAAILLSDQSILTGSNHENASYPAGICAERAALASLEMTDKSRYVKTLLVTYEDPMKTTKPISPCGICRQSLLEVEQWQGKPVTIYLCNSAGDFIFLETADCLMPFAFGSRFLSNEGS